MGSNNSHELKQQELSQATPIAGKVSEKKGCKDFRKFLNNIFSAQEMQDLPLNLGESKHQVTKWIKEPSTIPFLVAVYFMDQWTVSVGYETEAFKAKRNLQLLEQYEIGFDSMTLRHYHAIQQHHAGYHSYTFEELLRQWAGSSKLLKYYYERLTKVLKCNKHQLTRWIKYPQTIPHKEAVLLVNTLSVFPQYDQYRKGCPMNYHDKGILEEHSLYADFQIGFDTIPFRTVFKFLNQQKAID